MKKMLLLSGKTIMRLLFVVLFLPSSLSANATDTLTIVSWGGPYEASQTKAFFEPFTAQTGVQIAIERYNGGIDELREQVTSGRVKWDLIDMVLADNEQACALGLLETIDHASLASALDGTLATNDFYPGSLSQCGAGNVISSIVLAFDVRAFPGQKPQTVSALFNLQKFPGKRALQKQPVAILEWALRSYGVPHSDLYSLLSTGRGLDLAFARMDEIKDQIVWWEEVGTPIELLAAGEVVMASGYNGRFFDATVNKGEAIQMLWDNHLYEYSNWAIPRGAKNIELAKQFIHFATQTKQLAEQTKYIPYGPARRSSAELVWKHDASGIDIRPHLPTFPANFSQGIQKDHEWYAYMQERLKQRFDKWLNE